MRDRLRYFLIACAIVVVCGRIGGAVDRIEQYNKARPQLQPLLRSNVPADRIEALTKLQEFPIAEAVRLIHNHLDDPDERVSEAAYASLVKMSGKQEVCETLLSLAKKAVRKNDDGESAVPLLSALLTSDLKSVQRETDEFLEKTAASKLGVQVVLGLADELGSHHAEIDVLPLVRLSKTKIFADNFALRRSVVHALTQIPHRDAVGALIEMMDRVKGEAQADAVEHLAAVTAQIFGMEGGAWQRWWQEAKGTFEYPKNVTHAPYRSVANAASPYYYGMPLFAERVVFVLDTSGSMSGRRILAAKRELIQAINALADHVHFSIVVFNSSVNVWHKQLVPATAESKKAAIHYVSSQDAQSNTASYDALAAAFSFDTEAIYFLSDGAPTSGAIKAPVDIVAAITTINRTRRISLYTIGVGAGLPGDVVDVFLKTLAEENLGLYRRVDG